jgi:hypothetical protein
MYSWQYLISHMQNVPLNVELSSRIYLNTRVHKFSKIYELYHNSTCQKGDMKQVPYWGPTDIRHHSKKN